MRCDKNIFYFFLTFLSRLCIRTALPRFLNQCPTLREGHMLGCERASALPQLISVFITNGDDVKQGDTYSGAVVSTVNSHQREFSMFSLCAWVLSECSGSLLEFRNMLVRPVGNSLNLAVGVSANGWSLYVALQQTGDFVLPDAVRVNCFVLTLRRALLNPTLTFLDRHQGYSTNEPGDFHCHESAKCQKYSWNLHCD